MDEGGPFFLGILHASVASLQWDILTIPASATIDGGWGYIYFGVMRDSHAIAYGMGELMYPLAIVNYLVVAGFARMKVESETRMNVNHNVLPKRLWDLTVLRNSDVITCYRRELDSY